jgi:hypothetical protein
MPLHEVCPAFDVAMRRAACSLRERSDKQPNEEHQIMTGHSPHSLSSMEPTISGKIGRPGHGVHGLSTKGDNAMPCNYHTMNWTVVRNEIHIFFKIFDLLS